MQLTKKIIFDYFDGNHTSIQRKMIEEWLEIPENEELFFQYLDEWESIHPQYVIDKDKRLIELSQRIEVKDLKQTKPILKVYKINYLQVFKWVAAATIVFTSSWFGIQYMNRSNEVSYENLVQNSISETGETYEKQNLTNEPLLVSLPDGSSVVLQPTSKITYSPKKFDKEKREIILSGEAFFEVHKNPQKPFFVYANELITKVLGTSFTIKANPNSSKIEIIVKTGKVAVFMQNDSDKNLKMSNNSLDGLVLTANERLGVNRIENKLEKPVLIKTDEVEIPIHKLNFDFEDTPAIEILEVLEQAYHIEISYDTEKLTNCKLTAHLSDEPLLEKIKLICFALDASHEEIDGQIFIKSSGCQ